jgi:hypothetical protein
VRRPERTASWLAKGRIIWCSVVAAGLCLVLPEHVYAVSTQAQLNIQPRPCVVDVVQDGSQQAVQTQSADCDDLLPDLLTPVYGQKPPLPSIDGSEGLIARQRQVSNRPWSPIASTVQTGQPSQQTVGAAMAVAGGVGTVMAVTALGVDAALFEMRHSRQATRWVRSRIRS